jgi:cell division initiation protein
MDGTPHLLTDVKFSERRRGYDPEEVDNFLEKVGGAVAQLQDKLREATMRAEAADAKVAEAQRGLATAEAKLARTVEAAPVAAPIDDEAEAEKASKILLMAQKTASATIEDANDTAQQAVADAREKAANMIADAEAEAEATLLDARREADELVEQRRAIVVKDVKELEELRSSVQADIETLQQHLDDQRARIRRGLDALQLVLEDPDGLRIDSPPELHDESLAETLSESEVTDLEIETEVEVVEVVEFEVEVEESSDAEDPIVLLNNGVDISGVDLTNAPQPAPESDGVFGSAGDTMSRPQAGSASAAGFASLSTDEAEFPAVAVPELLKKEPDIDLASEELFAAADRDERTGPPTQSFSPFGETDDPLGPPDDAADKAMRAFFEADFESEEPPQKSRFGFRR